MSTYLAGVPADRQPGTGPGVRARSGVFALPVSTSFRFTLLIAAVVASSFFVYQGIYLATSRGSALISLIHRCLLPTQAYQAGGVTGYANALHRASVCYSGGERAEAWWGLVGVGVLIVVAGATFLAQPWWYRRRRHLTELTGSGAADLLSRLEGVRRRAGTGPVVWLLQPLDTRSGCSPVILCHHRGPHDLMVSRAQDFYRHVPAAEPVLDVPGMTEFDVGGATLGSCRPPTRRRFCPARSARVPFGGLRSTFVGRCRDRAGQRRG